MSTNKLVTVIIPTYNRADKIHGAIKSVLRQTYSPVQLIIVDDGSSDNTEEVVMQYQGVEYLCIEHAGQAAARNHGLSNAKGTFVASLDSDDEWEPEFLSSCVEKLETDQLDFVFTNWKQQQKNGSFSDFLSGDTYLQPYIKDTDKNWHALDSNDLRQLYLKACPSPSSSAVIRRTSVKNGWNKNIRIGDDWCFYLDMILSKPCKAAFTMEELWKKQINDINVYNGRNWNEVLEHLYIHDLNEFMTLFRNIISKQELQILQRKHIHSLVELAKHKVLRNKDFSGSTRLLLQSFKVSPIITVQSIPVVLNTGIKRQLKRKRK